MDTIVKTTSRRLLKEIRSAESPAAILGGSAPRPHRHGGELRTRQRVSDR